MTAQHGHWSSDEEPLWDVVDASPLLRYSPPSSPTAVPDVVGVDRVDAYVAQVVAGAPRLTAGQRAVVARLLRDSRTMRSVGSVESSSA